MSRLSAATVCSHWNTASFDDLLRTFQIVLFVAIARHRIWWKPSAISDAIERATG